MNEPSAKPTRSTDVFSKRRGRALHRTSVLLPHELVTAFRSRCIAQGTTMSAQFEKWAGQWLESLESTTPPGE